MGDGHPSDAVVPPRKERGSMKKITAGVGVGLLCAGIVWAQPSSSPTPGKQIAWVKDIRNAERLAKQNRRPIVLFTGDGNIGTGRC